MNIVKAVKASFKSLSLTIRKHAPEIMVIGGCVGTVGAAVLACKATLKTREVLEDANEKLDAIENEAGEIDIQKEKAVVRVKTVGKIALNYLPSVALGTASIMSILGGHHILKKRHLITVAALADQADRFDKYKKRIEEKLGIEDATKLLTGEHDEKVKETVTDPETGKEKSRNVTKTLLGEDLSGRFHITLDRGNTYDMYSDFDLNYTRFSLIESELNESLKEQALFGGGKAVLTAKDLFSRLGYKNMDADWIKKYRNAGCIWTKECPFGVSLGLEEARRLHDFGIKPDNAELNLSINLIPNIWDYV